MNNIFFPSQYKKAIINRKKNITIRYGGEFRKYKKGKTYSAKSYAGRNFDINVKILKITKIRIENLKELGINMNTIKKLKKEHKGVVEVIKFEVIWGKRQEVNP